MHLVTSTRHPSKASRSADSGFARVLIANRFKHIASLYLPEPLTLAGKKCFYLNRIG
jgi:hypothetical protein